MSLLQNSNAISAGGYDINNSLRFRSSASAYLNRTPASAGNRKTWTWSAWVKRGTLSSTDALWHCFGSATNTTYFLVRFESSGALYIGNASTNFCITTQVFRDPSAWYHIVINLDTTQATATDRLRVYVNGVQVTSFSSDNRASQISQNSDQGINQASVHTIGRENSGVFYLDGYLAEVNFIDGQALTPSSFGETDTTTGVWKPKAYTGTYGTNGFYLPFTQNTNSSYAVYASDAASNYHSLPTGSQGTNFTFTGDFTIEGWVLYSSAVGDQSFYVSNSGATYLALNIDMSGGNYTVYANSGTPSATISHGITVGNWTHVAMVRSGSTITVYTNGVARGTLTAAGTLGYSTLTLNRFGGGASGARFLSNVRITKSAVYTANFVPPTTALTNIANTVVLTYQNATAIDNSSNGYTLTATGSPSMLGGNVIWNANIPTDASGNKNHWTPNNINYSFYGTTYDAMTDSPTNTSATVANYANINPLSGSTIGTIDNANLRLYYNGANWSRQISTIGMTTGKYYAEFTISQIGDNSWQAGVASFVPTRSSANQNGETSGSSFLNAYQSAQSGAIIWNNSTRYNLGVVYSAGDVIGVAFDVDTATVKYYRNGSQVGNSGGYVPNTIDSIWYFQCFSKATDGTGSYGIVDANFGQRPFSYTPPTGYKALNTYNLPDSTIKKGNSYMDASLYTGTRATQVVVNTAGFKPDLVWCKGRSFISQILSSDSVRGTTKQLFPPLTIAEQTDSTMITSFNNNGFTLGDNSGGPYGNINYNIGATYVGWQWQAGQGTTSSNTNGSITSNVSVNSTAGFSVVTWTSNGTTGATIGHGLGVSPKFMIIKSRSNAGSWPVYHASIGNTGCLFLDTTDTTFTSANFLNNTTPTSTVFTTGASSFGWTNGTTWVAYCWAEIAGFSKFGSYTANNSADGPFIFLGFRPKFVMFKPSTFVDNWFILDTSRNTYNLANSDLYPNLSNAEFNDSNNCIDILSNGFKIRGAGGMVNYLSNTYIYAAFAENPFKNANAR